MTGIRDEPPRLAHSVTAGVHGHPSAISEPSTVELGNDLKKQEHTANEQHAPDTKEEQIRSRAYNPRKETFLLIYQDGVVTDY